MTAGRRLYQRYTYRAVVEHYGLRLCTDADTCRRRRSAVAHRYASGDSMGWIHMQNADDRMVTKKGMRTLLKAIASVVLDNHGKPTFIRVYEQDVWAWKEGDKVWKIRFPSSMSDRDRQRVLRSAAWNRVKLRSQYTAIYRWATTPYYTKEKPHGDATSQGIHRSESGLRLLGPDAEDDRPAGGRQGEPDHR